MEPLRGGMLANNIPKQVHTIWDKAEVKRTPAEWALRWVWNHPEITVVLSGMNEETQIEENLRIADEAYPNSLTPQELDLIKQAKQAFLEIKQVPCTGCQYCMPCPSGVDIPGCFDILNHPQGPPKIQYQLFMGGKLGRGKPSYASLCNNCGDL